MNKFLALLRKDWRLNRLQLLVLLFLGLASYILPATIAFCGGDYTRSVKEIICLGAGAGVLSVCLIMMLFGGNTFAADRRDGAADFLGMLPASRRIIILSKLTIAAGCPLAVGMIHGIVGYYTVEKSDNVDYAYVALTTAVAFVLFGVAWLCSTFFQNPSNAMVCSLFSVVFLFIFCGFIGADIDLFVILAFAIGIGTFIAGCAYYAQRVAP